MGSAVQRIGLSSPALVNENDVPRALDVAEDCPDLARQLGGRLSRPAGKEEERILIRSRAERRQYDNPELNFPSNTGVAVLEHGHRAAQGIGRAFTAGAGVKTVERPLRPSRVTSGHE
jgi:hypothetical protein